MTEPLDPETRRLRKLKPGELADEAGQLKAQLSDLQDRLDACRAEAIRRGITEAEGELFRLIMTPPDVQTRLDRDKLEQAFGPEFLALYSTRIETGWKMRVAARKLRRDRVAERGAKTP